MEEDKPIQCIYLQLLFFHNYRLKLTGRNIRQVIPSLRAWSDPHSPSLAHIGINPYNAELFLRRLIFLNLKLS